MYPEIHLFSVTVPSYPVLIAVGVLAAIAVRLLLPVRHVASERLGFLLVPGAFGLVIGAKLPVLLSHGFRAEILFSGKSLVGALLGAWAAVVLAKRWTGRTWTGGGDGVVLPLAAGLAVGRGACLFAGCCWGVRGLPVPAIEIVFHASAFAFFFVLRRHGELAGRWFPLYVLAYCAFRFGIEFVRTEPRVLGPFTAYQLFAAGGVVAGVWTFLRRAKREEDGRAAHAD